MSKAAMTAAGILPIRGRGLTLDRVARPLRVEFEHALYHVHARGNERASIFRDDHDRRRLLEGLQQVVTRYGWICRVYCLMGNHFHLMIETPNANLSLGMRQLNIHPTTVTRRLKLYEASLSDMAECEEARPD